MLLHKLTELYVFIAKCDVVGWNRMRCLLMSDKTGESFVGVHIHSLSTTRIFNDVIGARTFAAELSTTDLCLLPLYEGNIGLPGQIRKSRVF